jgi:hypothetical protein
MKRSTWPGLIDKRRRRNQGWRHRRTFVHDNGMIELTEAGFRRMVQAHSAGLDTVIEVDRRYLLRFPASPAR